MRTAVLRPGATTTRSGFGWSGASTTPRLRRGGQDPLAGRPGRLEGVVLGRADARDQAVALTATAHKLLTILNTMAHEAEVECLP